VVAVASTIVSQAEGGIVALPDVQVNERAASLAASTGRDAPVRQLYFDESSAVLEIKGRHVVTVDSRGFQSTGAGVDIRACKAPGRQSQAQAQPDCSCGVHGRNLIWAGDRRASRAAAVTA